MELHHWDTEGFGDCVVEVRERRKSEIMDFWVGVNWPYHKMETGISPRSTWPLWYVRRLGCGCTKALSFLPEYPVEK
ncbi:hypothetical protein ACMD2_12360 [Ananas comosus]|uniref:Uncharacterized protein n=1 Tax=Ananas comosus TaxID=4615 RepID=A0A199V691_ANACO|nr:hypothetical protein ACMD2_12360 [Ananas comosus]